MRGSRSIPKNPGSGTQVVIGITFHLPPKKYWLITSNSNNWTHLMPRSMCSWMPNPKFPLAEKFSFLSSYSLTLKPRSRISSAFAPLHNGPPFRQEQKNARGHRQKLNSKFSTFNVFQFTIKLLCKLVSVKICFPKQLLHLHLRIKDPNLSIPDPRSKRPRTQRQKGPGCMVKRAPHPRPKKLRIPQKECNKIFKYF